MLPLILVFTGILYDPSCEKGKEIHILLVYMEEVFTTVMGLTWSLVVMPNVMSCHLLVSQSLGLPVKTGRWIVPHSSVRFYNPMRFPSCVESIRQNDGQESKNRPITAENKQMAARGVEDGQKW